MAISYAYKQSIKIRKQRNRRIEVGSFFLMMATALVSAGHHWNWSWKNIVVHLCLYLTPLINVFWAWQRMGLVMVTSLDDRAMREYGVEFEQATEAQQKSLLSRYRVGTYVYGYFPDEYEETQERESHQRAYGVLRVLLPSVVAIYWLGWKLLPDGYARNAWTNGPVVLYWLSLLVIALPQIIRLWTEPDDPGEPKLVPSAAEKEA
jgi:hypothetical protein